jgi:hypothetical protein
VPLAHQKLSLASRRHDLGRSQDGHMPPSGHPPPELTQCYLLRFDAACFRYSFIWS